MKLDLEIITPVIINDSNELTSLDFFLDRDNIAYRVDINGTISNISKYPKLLEKFINIIKEDYMQKAQKAYGKPEYSKSTKINDFYAELERDKLLVKIYPQITKYDPKFLNQKNITNYIGFYKKIDDLIYYVPYIPGSTIKGAIRNAILYKILKEKIEMYSFKDHNKKVLVYQYFLTNRKNVEKEIFAYEDSKNKSSNNDIFKFLHITDFMPKNIKDIKLGIFQQKVKIKNYQNERNMNLVFMNLVLSGIFEGEIKIKKDLIYAFSKTEDKNIFLDRLNNIFNINEEEMANFQNNFSQTENKIILNLLSSLNTFSYDIIKKYENRYYPSIPTVVPDSNNFYAFLGAHKGLILNTILEAIDPLDRKKIYNNKNYPPKTNKLASIENKDVKLGFVKFSRGK
ncbi:MAG: type III-A CRISPR-associated RAMP protein Csm5 [Thermoplasmata archaeon]